MSKSTLNVVVLLGIIITVFGGYYFFTQDASLSLQTSGTSDAQLEQLLQSSQVFVVRSRSLDQIKMDVSLLRFDTFNSLRSYSPEPSEFDVGRDNPFTPVTISGITPLAVPTE